MSTGIIAALLLSLSGNSLVQPICTPEDFQNAVGSSIQGDAGFIARAVFDDYAQQVQALVPSEQKESSATPAQQLVLDLQLSEQVDALFDELLTSLSVVSNNPKWSVGVANLRRTVLLKARKFTNPWPTTVWVDITNITAIPQSVLFQIDTFLQNNIDEDRTERFMVSALQFGGDALLCKVYEKRSMQRWGEYLAIISPYINAEVTSTLYPNLKTGEKIVRIENWIYKNSGDEKIRDSVSKQIAIWGVLNRKQNGAIIQLVIDARKLHGFDPWSRGCGQQTNSVVYKIKNELLQKTAEIQEFNNSTCNSLLYSLPKELRQLYESEE
jgi:hypothetical protein